LPIGGFEGTAVLRKESGRRLVVRSRGLSEVLGKVEGISWSQRERVWLCEVVVAELLVVRRYDVMVTVDAENPE
jgi:hypothetical protein